MLRKKDRLVFSEVTIEVSPVTLCWVGHCLGTKLTCTAAPIYPLDLKFNLPLFLVSERR